MNRQTLSHSVKAIGTISLLFFLLLLLLQWSSWFDGLASGRLIGTDVVDAEAAQKGQRMIERASFLHLFPWKAVEDKSVPPIFPRTSLGCFCVGVNEPNPAEEGMMQLDILDLRSVSAKLTDRDLKDRLVLARSIHTLYLTGCKGITDDSLAALSCCKQLRKVSLNQCRGITDIGVRSVVACKQIQTLDLGECMQVTDVGVKELAGLPHLETLNLWGCIKITDKGVKVLGSCKHLKDLNIGAINVEDAWLKELANAKQLQILDITSCTRISDAGLQELVACKELKVLYMWNCPKVSKDGEAALKKALPKLKVIDVE
jgi:hypothetical protein